MNAEIKALLIETHRQIELASADAASAIRSGNAKVWYPPNGGLTDGESVAIASLHMTDVLESALRKLIASAAAASIFHTLACIDNVGDPEAYEGEWSGLAFCSPPDGHPEDMLHDEFTESYWAWREIRTDPGWKLDSCNG